MSIDNTYTFSLNETSIITRALQLCGAIAKTETPDTSDMMLCSDYLNGLLKTWDALGLHQWKLQRAGFSVLPNSPLYGFGTNIPGYANGFLVNTPTTSTDFVSTTLTTAITVPGSSATLVVANASSFANGDTITLVQNDGTQATGTITNIAGLSISTTITTTTTSAIGNYVFDYDSAISKPMAMYDVNRLDTGGIEIPLTQMSSGEYFELPNKTGPGVPVSYFFQPMLSYSLLYLWPVPTDLTTVITFRYSQQLSDLLNSADTPDLPQEFYLALVYNLAVIVAPVYGRLNELDKLLPMSQALFKSIEDWDQEHTNIQWQPFPWPND